MSLLDIAWTVVAFLVAVLVLVACAVLVNLFRVLSSVKEQIDGVGRRTLPILEQAGDTLGLVNQELTRVDGILETAETVTGSVGHVVNVVSSTVTSPLVKLSAFAWGLRRAAGRVAEDEPAGKRKRGFGRRR